jgi:hypothetical protein
MTASPKVPRRYDLFLLAVLLLIAAGTASAMSGHSLVVLVFGLVMIVASVLLVRRSNVNPLITTGPARDVSRGRVGPLAWTWGVLSLLALCISLYLLHTDALEGEPQVWPWTVAHGVLFAAAIVVLILGECARFAGFPLTELPATTRRPVIEAFG